MDTKILEPILMPDAEGSCIPFGYYIRGHHDKNAFCEGVKHHYGKQFDPEQVKHIYYRVVPHPEFGLLLHESKPGKGAFPATVVEN